MQYRLENEQKERERIQKQAEYDKCVQKKKRLEQSILHKKQRASTQYTIYTNIQQSRALSTASFFIFYIRTAVPLTATISIPSRTTS